MNDSIVPITDDVVEALLKLNNDHATETSELGPEAWHRLIEHAFHAVMLEDGAGFLIALDQGAPYANVNHGWFRARYERFVYVDRLLVAPEVRGRGHAARFYEDLFERARSVGHGLVACEVNVDPPNPASDALHARLGFVEVGRLHRPEADKTVRYLVRELD